MSSPEAPWIIIERKQRQKPDRTLQLFERVKATKFETINPFAWLEESNEMPSPEVSWKVVEKKQRKKLQNLLFQTLPLELRYQIYDHLLPWGERIIDVVCVPSKDNAFRAFSFTCKRANGDIREWFKVHRTTFKQTANYGLLNLKQTIFKVIIDSAFRECETDPYRREGVVITPSRPGQKWDLLDAIDRTAIRHIILHFKTEDVRVSQLNSAAIHLLHTLPNLELVEILIGNNDLGCMQGWGRTKEAWEEALQDVRMIEVREGCKLCIPVKRGFWKPLPLVRGNDKNPPILKLWLMGPKQGDGASRELLASYNDDTNLDASRK